MKEESTRFGKYWTYLIYLTCLLLIMLPISTTFTPGSGEEFQEEQWGNNYAFNTIEYAIIIFPIVLLLIITPKLEHRNVKKVLIVILVLLSFISFLWAVLAIILPVQDFIPSLGVGVLLMLFPIVGINSIMEWNRSPTS